MATPKPEKSVTEIIAGALELWTRGARGGILKRARWNNENLHIEDDHGEGKDTYCALGAIGMAAAGNADYFSGNARKAADLVASCVPPSVWRREGVDSADGCDIPSWNDSLSEKRGFTSIKRVFCKALKKSMKKEGKRERKRKRAA